MRTILLIALLFVAGCDKPTDDVTQIRAMIETVKERARAHDVDGMMEHVTSDYTADPGQRDEQAVRPLLMLALRRYGKFRVEHPSPGIVVAADAHSAEVSLPFLVVREGQEAPAGLAELAEDPAAWAAAIAESVGDPYQLDLELRKTPDGWKIRGSEISGFKNVGDL